MFQKLLIGAGGLGALAACCLTGAVASSSLWVNHTLTVQIPVPTILVAVVVGGGGCAEVEREPEANKDDKGTDQVEHRQRYFQ